MASAFVFLPFLVGQFGLTDFGVYLLALSVSGYLGLLDLGVGATVIKLVAEHRARGDAERLSAVVSSALVFFVGIGILAAVALAFFGAVGVGLFELAPPGRELASRLFFVAAALAVLWWPANLGGTLLSGLQEYRTLSYIAVSATAVNMLGTVAVLVWDLDLLVLFALNSLTGVGAGVAYWFAARRRAGDLRVSLSRAKMASLREIFSLSWAMFAYHVCTALINQQTDRVVLGVFRGAVSVSLYEGPAKMQSAVSQAAAMTATAVLPAASQFEAEDRFEALQTLFLRGSKLVVAFVGSLAATLLVLAGPLLRAWLGPDFEPVTSAARLLVAGWLVTANIQVAWVMIMGLGRMRSVLPYLVVQSVANVVVSVALVRSYGVLGVVIGTVATNVAVTPFILRYALRMIRLETGRWFRRVVAPVYPLLLVPVAIGVAAMAVGLPADLPRVAATAAAALGASWVATYFFGLDIDERDDVRAFAAAALEYVGIPQRGRKGA